MNDAAPLNTEQFAEKAAVQRAEILQQDTEGYTWRGVLLQPYSFRRELYFQMISLHMSGVPEYERCNTLESLPMIEEYARKRVEGMPEVAAIQCINWAMFMPETAAVLWLCSHDQAQILHARADLGSWVDCIMEWAEGHIPKGDAEQAVRLAYRLISGHRHFLVQSRPERGAKGPAGN